MQWTYQYLINQGVSIEDASLATACIFILLVASIMSLVVHLFKK